MKIRMIHWFYFPQVGGVETFLKSVCEELVKREHDVSVLASPVPGCPEKEIIRGVKIQRSSLLPNRPTNLTTNVCRDLYKFLLRFLKGADVVYLSNFHTPQFCYQTISIFLAAREEGVKSFLHMHGLPKLPLDGFLISQVPWDGLIVSSNWMKSKILLSGVADRKVSLLPCCVNTEFFSPELSGEKIREELGVEKEKLVFCPARLLSTTEGKIQERKNLFTLLEAAAILKKDFTNFKILFTVVGSKVFVKEGVDAQNRMKERARALGVEKNIIMREFSREEMPSVYSASDLVILPSVDEPFGIVYLEAMSSGKPVIGARSGASPEVIQVGKTGYLAEPKNPKDLAEKILTLLLSEDKWKEFGLAGRKLVEKRYTVGKVTGELERIFVNAHR
jgi:glycosyltransferase involved in cell wall biosynthesis